MFQPLVEQFGGKILSDDGKTAYLNSPETVKALTLWRDVTKECRRSQDHQEHRQQPEPGLHRRLHRHVGHRPVGDARRSRKSPIKNDFTVVSDSRRSIPPSRTPSSTAGRGA